MLQFASDELRQDQEVVFLAVSHDPSALEFASEELRGHDPEFVPDHRHPRRAEPAVRPRAPRERPAAPGQRRRAARQALRHVAPDLRHDREFILSIVREPRRR